MSAEQDIAQCDAKIRPMPDLVHAHEIELMCLRPIDHADSHEGQLLDYAYPGSRTTVSWQETDRRNFRGEYTQCKPGCFLPAGHQGGHW